jgi:hypothetical protein
MILLSNTKQTLDSGCIHFADRFLIYLFSGSIFPLFIPEIHAGMDWIDLA